MRWEFRKFNQDEAARLAAELKLPALIAQLLCARGITRAEEASAFLNPSLKQLHSPYLMRGMAAAVERIAAALARGERTLIYGDYDVDGTTAIIVLKTAIELCGGAAEFHVPHRVREGYDLRSDVLERAAGEGIRLVISVDSGIRAFAAAEAAERAGLDLIITDHHLPEAAAGDSVARLPKALAVLNPNQEGCGYPCKALCGAGVAFKLAQALLERHGRQAMLASFAKVVAIATIADAVPLVGENRAIAAIGLRGLRDPRNPGLRELLCAAGVDLSRTLNTGDIAFRVAPRLNAAGRMDVAQDVVELFSVRDAERARELAAKLNTLNAARQAEEQRIVEALEQQIGGLDPAARPFCVVASGEGWHRGVVGIAASRAVERYGRPALVVARDENGQAHGSGRSIRNFHLLGALESCRELFTRYGGHAHAVGFSLPSERLPELAERLDAYARERLGAADFEPALEVDAAAPLQEISHDLFHKLQQLAPFGHGNPEPRFAAHGVKLLGPPRLLKEKHLKLKLARQRNGSGFMTAVDALGWRMGARLGEFAAGDLLDVAFTVEENSHPEFGGLQLSLLDVNHAAAAATSVS